MQLGERELAEDAADRHLGSQRSARDRADRGQRELEAEADRPRQPALEQEVRDHLRRAQLVALLLAEGLEGAARSEQAREPLVRDRRRLVRHQARHLDGEQARGRVGALEMRAELEELVGLAARQRRLHHALEGVRALADAHEELVRRGRAPPSGRVRETSRCSRLRCSHISLEICSRTPRAFSRARATQAVTASGLAGCQSMNSVTACAV